MHDVDDFDRDGDPGDDDFRFLPAWIWNLAWPLVVLIAIAVVEATSHPLFGIGIICTKASWGKLASAFWVRFRDADPQRGRTLFWFMAAWAMCSVLIWSLTLAVITLPLMLLIEAVLIPLFRRFGLQLRPIDPGLEILFLLMFVYCSFLPILAFTTIGCVQARRRGIRVWIDASIDAARRARVWPPLCRGPLNDVNKVLAAAKCILVYVMLTNLGVGLILIPPPFGWLYGLAMSIVVWRIATWVGSGVSARFPAECWLEAQQGAETDSPAVNSQWPL